MYERVPLPITPSKRFVWKYNRDIVFKVIFTNVDDYILESLIDFEFSHALWTQIFDLCGDHDIDPFMDDPIIDFIFPLHRLERIPYECETIRKFGNLEYFDTLVDVSLEVGFSSSKIVNTTILN